MILQEIKSKSILLTKDLTASVIRPSVYGTTFPIAPTVTVFYSNDSTGKGALFFRIVVFIDSDYNKPPVLKIDDKKNNLFYVVYDLPEKEAANYSVWYIEAIHPSEQLASVSVYLQNNDPKTSRGTSTSVEVVVPD